ncbi:MAG: hypothetical protein EPN70_09490 [Paraburkholderia sp.]|uniref:hypothetical protein n=1 Tax=Paraburkholderia sp. TaxID=1926495 RepID=UPI0011FCD8D5|nr:hypothetical protein [Paraburkholderia sp.]TAM05150.1 MAG: hypothetical protein EPN70_09490 [Paraburkholderia sp.]TAM28865.1 MAG: hypothetical protein EPN59_14265 [Paraburkholderia sp.]
MHSSLRAFGPTRLQLAFAAPWRRFVSVHAWKPAGVVTLLAGWIMTRAVRQLWVVHDVSRRPQAVMRRPQAVSHAVTHAVTQALTQAVAQSVTQAVLQDVKDAVKQAITPRAAQQAGVPATALAAVCFLASAGLSAVLKLMSTAPPAYRIAHRTAHRQLCAADQRINV